LLGLGIESTCDETSLAIVEDGRRIVFCETDSQIQEHKVYRGVVPEIASRAHLTKLNFLLERMTDQGFFRWQDIDYVAVSNRPGLIGSILMGAQMARCISLVHGIPIVPVNHLEAHVATVRLEEQDPEIENSWISFPYLAVLLSGGNSAIYIHKDWGEMEILGDTLDDALGEAFDKAASILGLPYPGGPHIENLAQSYLDRNASKYSIGSLQGLILPRLLKDSRKIQFSFSGLKTALLYALQENPNLPFDRLAYEFQEVSFDLVLRNIVKSVHLTQLRTIVAGGGVLANSMLRNKLDNLAKKERLKIVYPRSRFLCTDNAAMVACLGYYLFQKGSTEGLDFPVSPRI